MAWLDDGFGARLFKVRLFGRKTPKPKQMGSADFTPGPRGQQLGSTSRLIEPEKERREFGEIVDEMTPDKVEREGSELIKKYLG